MGQNLTIDICQVVRSGYSLIDLNELSRLKKDSNWVSNFTYVTACTQANLNLSASPFCRCVHTYRNRFEADVSCPRRVVFGWSRASVLAMLAAWALTYKLFSG